MTTPPRPLPLTTETVTVGGRRYVVHRPPSAEDLIDEGEFDRDERLPYWADLWPSGRVLADLVAQRDVRGRRVVELGCGLGVPSLVALDRGATVLATDWYEVALKTARASARDSLGRDLDTMLVDWRTPPVALLSRAPFDLVIAADVLYENRNAHALARLLPALAAKHTEVVITDPRRPDAEELWSALDALGWMRASHDVTLTGPGDEAGRVVRVHRLWPRGGGPTAHDASSESDRLNE